MSKKTLLNEATVRRFMKLADMGTKSDNFINEMGYYQADEDEAMDDEPVDMGDEPMDDMADEAPEMPGDEGPEDEPMPEEEPEEEPEMDADEVEISEDDRAALAAAIPVLEKIAGGAGDMDMGDMDMGDEAGMRDMNMMEGDHKEETMEEGAGMKHDKEENMDEADDKALDEVEVVEEDELVQEVTRRVAARLRAAMKSRK